MTLNKEVPPYWFVQKLSVTKDQTVVATDDDFSILEIWKQRLSELIRAKIIWRLKTNQPSHKISPETCNHFLWQHFYELSESVCQK